MNRGLVRAMAACALGGLLVLIAQSLVWARAAVPRAAVGVQHVSVHGHDIERGLPAVGYALLALAVALLASRGPVRRLAGFVVVLVGLLGAAAAAASLHSTGAALLRQAAESTPAVHSLSQGPNLWWLVAFVGALLAAAGGAAALLRGGAWDAMSQRYESPQPAATAEPAAPDDDVAAWRAIDRGEDPTA